MIAKNFSKSEIVNSNVSEILWQVRFKKEKERKS